MAPTALDRARQVARTYRAALTHADPARAAILDAAAARAGEHWVCGVTTGEQACTVPEAAALLQVTPGRVRQLIADGTIPSAGRDTRGHVLLLADVLAHARARLRTTD